MKRASKKGFVTLIFILIIALIATLVLMMGQSRLFLSLQRGQSFSDTLIAGYQAESEINDLLYKIFKGYVGDTNFSYSKELGENFKIDVTSKLNGNLQTIDVTSSRAFAVSQVQAVINSQATVSANEVEIAIMLDCSGSMGDKAAKSGNNQTRMEAQSAAIVGFLNEVNKLPGKSKISVGVGAFSTSKNWIKTSQGIRISPDNKVPVSEIISTMQTKFRTNRNNSPACLDALGTLENQDTNVGGGYTFMNDYFASRPTTTKKIQILITDGEPNSSNEYPGCFTKNTNDDGREGEKFLRCALTDRNTLWDGVHFGVRNPDILTYGVTVLDPADKDINDIFVSKIGAENYFTATEAAELPKITKNIFNQIVSGEYFVTIKRVIPGN